jgi:hypothetical protein
LRMACAPKAERSARAFVQTFIAVFHRDNGGLA